MDMHSVINLLSILHGELTLVGCELAGDPGLLAPALALCDRMQEELSDPRRALQHAAALPDYEVVVGGVIEQACDRHPREAGTPAVCESVANIRSVFGIFAVRARELLARARAPAAWASYRVDELRGDLLEVLTAIEKNSRGRYRIRYNLAQQEPGDYYADLEFTAAEGGPIVMPPVMKDVMRDLLANARKYTEPGGAIGLALFEDRDRLRITVQDTGCGIPEAEIEEVVHYGRRGSNVLARRTLGGGFGLTKAFLATKQFGGRFWIQSEIGVGTRVRLEVPRADARAVATEPVAAVA
jgi:signal transduction histidine kinase